ncbi:MAG: hypothetical protein HC917_24055, partial [Richelia sp. SM2_1_7]|nr:hypothetical protein [Richelia sp. SM2_1_7]
MVIANSVNDWKWYSIWYQHRLDLAFVLPLLVIGAVLLFRKKPFGDLLAPVILIKAGTLGFSVFLGELLKPYFGQGLDPFMIGL